MAQTDEQAPPRTIRVDGGSGNTLSYELPPGVAFDVETVHTTIDASGAGDTFAEVAVVDQTGVVIARKRAPVPVPGGDTGSATFALGVADDEGLVRMDADNHGGWIRIHADGAGFSPQGRLDLFANFEILLTAVDSVTLGANHLLLNARGGDLTMLGVVSIFADSQLQFWRTTGGTVFELINNAHGRLFRVDEDGQLHGKAGKSLVFDL